MSRPPTLEPPGRDHPVGARRARRGAAPGQPRPLRVVPDGGALPPRQRPRPEDGPRAVRRAVTLLLLTLVAPGAAQVAAGRRRAGLLVLRIWAGLIGLAVLGAVLYLAAPGAALGIATSPTLLAVLGVVLVVGGVVWPVLMIDAWRLGQHPHPPPLRARRWLALLTVLLVLLTSVPAIGLGRRAWAAGDLIGSVFDSGRSSAASHGRYNVLLLGGDAGENRIGLRPDSITLASIDEDTGRTVLLGLPRNLENVPFPAGTPAARALPDGWSCGDECLLNAVYQYGSQNPELFPGVKDPGAEAMKQAVSAVTGLTVNYYVLIDLKGFRQLVDAVGGVKLDVRARVPVGGGSSPVFRYIEPGTRTLDGQDALWFARSREGSSDYERMTRQRCVMDAMLAQLSPATVLDRFQEIATAGKQVVSTDVPQDDLGGFLELATKAKDQKVTSVQFTPPLITPARPDLALVRSRVAKAIDAAENPPEPKPSASPKPSAKAPDGEAKDEPSKEPADDVRAACAAA